MRRLLLLAFPAFLAACGGGTSQESEISNQAIKRVLVHAYVGSVFVTTHTSSAAVLEADTSESNDLDEFMIFKVQEGVLRVRPVDAALEWETTIELTLPEFVELEIAARKADVQVEGAYKDLTVSTTIGDIDVHADRLGAATIKSDKGRVAFSTQQTALTGSLSCSSAMGNVTATLPGEYRGRLYFTTTTGSLNVPEHKTLHLTRSNTRTALGFAGAPLTDKERAEEQGTPVFRATSASGTVTFHLGGD